MDKLNQYIDINRVEFVITYKCTSKCKHCSVADNKSKEMIDSKKVEEVIEKLSSSYKLKSVMTFGGEPLLFSDLTCSIHKKAFECGIPIRQLITNGCFSKDDKQILKVAKALEESHINNILVSVDCFHKEYLPLDKVYKFVSTLKANYSGKLELQPAWLISKEDDNPYNRETKACLEFFNKLDIKVNDGNIIFPSGNALKNLSCYFEKKLDMNFKCGAAPYTEKLDNINEISIAPNGDVMICSFKIGNVIDENILDILKKYDPFDNPFTKALILNGISGLINEAQNQGIYIDISKYYTPCDICVDIFKNFNYNKII